MSQLPPSPPNLWEQLAQRLHAQQQAGLAREIVRSQRVSPTTLERRGKRLVHFGSNDYLSLSSHPEIAETARQATLQSVGSGSSPVVAGATPEYLALADALAAWKQSEAAMVFSSGYACNLGTLTALAGREDILFSDALNHACLIDGCRLSRGRVVVYPHNDMQALESLLAEHRSNHRNAFIVTDTVFSMDGDVADVEAIDRLCDRYSATALADEAHAGGVLGPAGRGVLAQHDWFAPGQSGRSRWVATGTLSKALGTHGGFVTGPAILEQWLIHHARSWVYSTAMPASVCAAATTAVRLAATMDAEREHLASMSRTLRQRLSELGLTTRVHDITPIVPVTLGDNHRVVEISQRLLECGLYVPAIRPPTVPRDAAMLRISLNAAHQPEEIDRLLSALRDAIPHSPTR